jgi:general stress protein 26
MGPATATFVAKDHKLFARFTGHLHEERNRDTFERLWTNPVAAWFPHGKDSPDVLLMRMDLEQVSIWNAEVGALTLTRMLLGLNVRDQMQGQHAQISP